MPTRAYILPLVGVWVAPVVACDRPGEIISFSRVDAGRRAAPAHIQLELIAESSRSDPGWTGAAYGSGPPAGSHTTIELEECDSEQRRCRLGEATRGELLPINQRCINDLTKTCVADADCGDGGICRFVFPPFTGAAAELCTLVYFEPGGSGVFDLKTGELTFESLPTRVGFSLAGPCRECRGDVVHRDGVRDGTCEGTETPCDVAATTAIPPAQTSYDCGPSDFTSLGFDIPVDGASTVPSRWTHDESRPRCTVSPFTGLRCWCGVCEGTTEPCHSDVQCDAGVSCGEDPESANYQVAPDDCADTSPCDFDEETQTGSCVSESGETIGCLPRSGSIEARAWAEARVEDGFYISTIGLLSCLPPSGNVLIDSLSGFPGPLFYLSSYRVTPLYE